MATTPNQKPVPSEDYINMRFNAGKLDEFVTSQGWTYTDRFGLKRYTIEGLNYLAQQAMSAYGYVTLSGVTFTTGATINNPNEVLLNTANGEYYKWTGSFASGSKVVPANSTPASTGGVGVGKWLSVGDATLRGGLASNNGASLIGTHGGISLNWFIPFSSYSDMLTQLTNDVPLNAVLSTQAFYAGSGVGGSYFRVKQSDNPPAMVQGCTIPFGSTGKYLEVMFPTNTANLFQSGAVDGGLTPVNSFIQYCWDNGVTVNIPKGSFIVQETMYIREGCRLVGTGMFTSSLKVPSGATFNIIDTQTFSSGDPALKITSCTFKDFELYGSLESLSVDQVDALDATSGAGLRLFGGRYDIQGVQVTQIPGVGIQILRPSDNSVSSGYMVNCASHKCGQENYILEVVDLVTTNCVAGWAWNTFQDARYSTISKTSKYCTWLPTDIGAPGLVIAGSIEISGQFHVHNNGFGYGVVARRNTLVGNFATRLRASHLISESCAAFVYLHAADSHQITKLDCHTPKYGNGSHALVQCNGLSYTALDEVNIMLDSISADITTLTVISLPAGSANCNIKGNIRCFQDITGKTITGVQALGTGHNLDIQVQGLTRGVYLGGTAISLNLHAINMIEAGLYLTGSAKTASVTYKAVSCNIGIGSGTTATEYGVIYACLINCATPIQNLSGLGVNTWDLSNLMVYATNDDSTFSSNHGVFVSAPITTDLQDGTTRTVVIPTTLLRAPRNVNINLNVTYSTGGRSTPAFFRVIATTISTITVEYQVPTGGSASITFAASV